MPDTVPPAESPIDAKRLLEAARTIERLRDELRRARRKAAEPLAVVGMALRMPGGADDPDRFWRLLRDGVDTVGEFPADRGDGAAVTHPDPEHPGTAYVTRGAFLGRVDGFDPEVFGISPREAVGMDPQQRIALELAWEALEHAGYAPDGLVDSATGVFVGVSTTDYVRMRQQLGDPDDVDHYQLLGEPSFVAGRISYTFGLQGPSQVVDTTCSSSLVALDGACRALRDRRCDVALAGGVNLMLSPYGFLLMSKFRALAPDGRCKTFDESADGYVRGEGASLLVLKRLTDALDAGDRVRGVILGSAVNHDGASSGLTVPNGDAQQRVLRAALADAGVEPPDVDYVEAHGTGTSLGDPIELRALDAVYGAGRAPDDPLLVGSVKTNIGHLEPAAGIAGVAKALLALEHGEIPPHLHLVQATTRVPWSQLRLEVPTRLRPWPARERPRRAAVSSFGASGTNAHVILAEGPAQPPVAGAQERPEALLLSARTPTALATLARRLADRLRSGGARLADVAYTTQVGRARLAEGAVIAAASPQEAVAALDALANGTRGAAVRTRRRGPRLQRSAWLLPGQGSQFLGMAAGLRALPAFARPLDEALAHIDRELGTPLADILWTGGDADRVNDTAIAQPALFAVSYALGTMLLDVGARRPIGLLGHSVGEIAAACLAGALDLPDAARLVVQRGRLMSALAPGGAMVALACDERRACGAIPAGARVAVAAVNGPEDVVLSGAEDEIERIGAALEAEGVRAQRLRVSHAFHSPLIEPALVELRAVAGSIQTRPPSIPIVSNVSGDWWGESQLEPEYWVAHAASTVRFAEGVRLLHAEGARSFLELGAHPVLVPLAQRALSDDEARWLAPLRRGRDDLAALQEALGRIDLEGGRIDWRALHEGRDLRREELPTYPWERTRHWFAERAVERAQGPDVDGLGRRLRAATPTFEQESATPPEGAEAALPALVERAIRAGRATATAWSELGAATVAAPIGPSADAPWLVHTSVRGDGRSATVAVDGASVHQVAAGEPWLAHGSVELVAEGHGAAGDAQAWRALLEQAGCWLQAELAGAAAPGWLAGLDGARCPEPERVAGHRVVVRERREHGAVADVELLDRDGTVVGALAGVSWRTVAPASATPWYPADDVLLELRWRAATPAPERPASRRMSLCGGDDALAERLAAALADRGADVDRGPAVPSAAALAGVDLAVVLDPVALPGAPLAVEDLTGRALDRDVALAQLVAGLDDAGPRVAVLTRGAMATDDQRAHAPAGATLHGLGRVLALEHPHTWAGAVDLDPDAPDDAGAIADALLTLDIDDEQAVRGERRLVPRVVRRSPPVTTSARLHRPGTVLVTGGLGAIGAQLGCWLARRGTERIVLSARSALPPEVEWPALPPEHPAAARVRAVEAMRALGAQVEVVAVDVVDEAAMGALVARLVADERLPLRGVVHAAGVSDPQFARELDADRYAAVWLPKVAGAWILHRATRDADLDLFVCLSSVAASWGSQHLSSYASSNAFLDALAHARRAENLPALTVAWGPWALPSGLFDEEVLAFMESIGLRQLGPGQCLDLLGRLQSSGATQAMVCAADWSTYRPVMEARRPRPRLAEIAIEEAGSGHANDALLATLAAAGEDDRVAILVEAIRDLVADVLKLGSAAIDADGEVFSLGIDSLMVMELVGRLRSELRVEARPSELFERDSVRAWASYVATLLDAAGPAPATAEPSRWQTTAALSADARLAGDIVPGRAVPASAPGRLRDVVLTGATGFVGAFVLRELLDRGAERVRCLVRADTPAAGWERIAANAASYLGLPDGARERVQVIPGDLAAAGLGLDEAARTALIEQADAIVHVGAAVNFAHPYDRLRAANVGATEDLLRLGARHGVALHHVSTYGVWGMPVDGRDVIHESDDIAGAGRLVTGYVQSKWAAERLVVDASARGVAAVVYRLGRVLGEAETGVALTTHFTLRVIKGAIQLGAAPDLDLDVEMTPVDYVASALVHIAATKPPGGGPYHLVNGRHMPFAALVDQLGRRGWKLQTLAPEEWYTRLERTIGHDENELHSVMDTVRELVVGGERAIAYDDELARAALRGSPIACPPLDERLLDTYLDYLVRTAYLPPTS